MNTTSITSPISGPTNPLLFFKNSQALGKQIKDLSLIDKQWGRLAKEFERKPLNLTLEDEKFQMLDGLSIVEKRDLLKKAPLYTKIFSCFFSKKYRERMQTLAEGLFELMQSGSQVILDEEQVIAEQKRRLEEWKAIANAQKPISGSTKNITPSINEDLDTPLIESLFLGNLQSFLSMENLLAKLGDLKFTGKPADKAIHLGQLFKTIGLNTLQDCKDKGIQDNFTADQYLEKNKKNFKQLILNNHGNVIHGIKE
jgi:hypothetical protein